MKALARSSIWWPGIDKEIEETAKTCLGCQLMQAEPGTAPVYPWEWPSSPWQLCWTLPWLHVFDCRGCSF